MKKSLVLILLCSLNLFGFSQYTKYEILQIAGGATPPADATAPTVPGGLAASSVAQTGFNLSWSASTDNVAVTLYEIFKGGASIGTASGTSFTVTGLTASTTYSFTVRAKDAANNYSAQSAALSVTTAAVVAAGPFTASSVTGLKAWVDATDAAQVTLAGSDVITIADKSGNGKDMVQTNSGARGQYITTGGLNNNKFLRLAGDKSIRIPNLPVAQPFTFYLIGKHGSNIGYMATFNAAKNMNMFVMPTFYGEELFDYTISIAGGGSQYGRFSNILRLDQPQIWRFGFWGADTTSIRINNEPSYPRTFQSGGGASMENFNLGGENVGLDFYEMLVFDHKLTRGEDAKVMAYLNSKYPVNNGAYIATLGNSITEGLNASAFNKRYTWLLAKALGVTLYNYGISGATLHQAMGDQNKGVLDQIDNAIGKVNNGIITIVAGYNNDFSGGTAQQKAQWEADYGAGVQKLIDSGYSPNNIYLFSPLQNVNATATNSGHSGTDVQTDEMEIVIRRIAANKGVKYGDLLHYSRAHKAEYGMGDGIHPEDPGNQLMTNFMLSVIQGNPLQ